MHSNSYVNNFVVYTSNNKPFCQIILFYTTQSDNTALLYYKIYIFVQRIVFWMLLIHQIQAPGCITNLFESNPYSSLEENIGRSTLKKLILCEHFNMPVFRHGINLSLNKRSSISIYIHVDFSSVHNSDDYMLNTRLRVTR